MDIPCCSGFACTPSPGPVPNEAPSPIPGPTGICAGVEVLEVVGIAIRFGVPPIIGGIPGGIDATTLAAIVIGRLVSAVGVL